MKRILIATLLAASGIAMTTGANAQVTVNVGGPPVVVGWHGDRYYDGHRYWERREWIEHHRYDRPHCPPGHWGHNECRW